MFSPLCSLLEDKEVESSFAFEEKEKVVLASVGPEAFRAIRSEGIEFQKAQDTICLAVKASWKDGLWPAQALSLGVC